MLKPTVLLLGLLGSVAGLGCHVAPCNRDGQCPPQTYCNLPSGGGRGVCEQECLATSQCGSGKLCTRRGQCVVASGSLGLKITEPSPGAQLSPGTTVDVAGVVTQGSESITLTLTGVDGLGCTPVPRQALELVTTGKREETQWRFTGVPVGEGGGRFTVAAKAGLATGNAELVYASTQLCADCPTVEISQPTPEDTLEPYALGVVLTGRLISGVVPPLLFSENEAGQRLVIPLPLGEANPFTRRILPVAPGLVRVGVTVQGGSGTRDCSRVLEAVGASTPLSAHLSWEGETTDLDLVVVPPGRSYTSGACRALEATGGCTVPTGDRTAPGPEAVLVENLTPGTWGVMVLCVPGGEGPIHAVATVLAQGSVVGQSAPRGLDPRVAQVWLVARAVVGTQGPQVEWLDRVVDQAPGGPPDTW